METKRILFTAPCVAELVPGQIEAPEPGFVTVQIMVTTISSGTERANLVGDPNTGGNRAASVKFPRSSGYSSAGIITAVGEGVEHLQVGQRVALFWSKHVDYMNIEADKVVPIDDVPFEEAALWHISTFPLAAIRKCRIEVGESAIVMGVGVLGMMAIKLLRAAGAAPIIAVDPTPEKREYALTIGADYALDPFAEGFAQKAKELTGGGANVAIEVTGNGPALDMVLDCMARFGRVALLGCTRDKNFTIDYYRKVHFPGITLVGAHTMARPNQESFSGWWTTRDDILAVKRLYQNGRLCFSDMIQETHSPAECGEVYTRLANEKSFPLVQFDWRKL